MQDIIVAGGGIIGSLSALRLAQRGLSVCVFDSGRPGAASSAAAGILGAQAEATAGDDALFSFGLRARAMHGALSDEMRAVTGHDVGYRAYGSLVSGIDLGWQRTRAVRLERLGREWFCPDDAQVDAQLLHLAIRQAASATGVLFRREEIVRVHKNAAETLSRRWPCGAVIAATGAWVSELFPAVEVEPVHGVLCEFFAEMSGQPVRFSPRAYLVSHGSGRVIAGFTASRIGFSDEVTDGQRAELLDRVGEFAPELAGKEPLRFWSGLRPAALRGIPIIDRKENTVIAAGQHRNGILHAPLVAECVVALALGELPPVDLQAFALAPQEPAAQWEERALPGAAFEPKAVVADTFT